MQKEIRFTNPGLVPSPEDPRDLLTSQIIPEIKRYPKECPCPFDLEVIDQNGLPFCVGCGGATYKEFLEKREKIDIQFDWKWLYAKCKEIDGHPELRGTYLRALLKVLQKFGAKPLNGSEEEARNYKISAYARIDNITFEELKKHIFVYGMLLVGFQGSNEGWRTAYIRPPKPGEKTWGHCVVLKAFNENYLIGQNSWGIDYGVKGDFYVPKNYLPFEAWVVLVDYPTLEKQTIKEGWVALPYLNLAKVGNVGSTLTRLNLREEPNGKILTTLEANKKCKLIDSPVTKGKLTWVKIKLI